MNNNDGPLFTLLICCGWPLLFHIIATYGLRYLARIDWKNIQWQNLKAPWSKDE